MRDAAPGDRPALLDLWVAAWRAAMPEIDFAARRAWLDASLGAFEASGTRVIVVDFGGRPAGFMTIDPVRGVIDQLAVDPACQSRGLASQLLDGAKTLCPGGVELVVNRDNAPARRLYLRHEFRETGEGINTISGLPTVVMRWVPPKQACRSP